MISRTLKVALVAALLIGAVFAEEAKSGADGASTATESQKPVKTLVVGEPKLSPALTSMFIIAVCAAGFAFAMFWWNDVSKIQIEGSKGLEEAGVSSEVLHTTAVIGKRVSDGAITFLWAEYKYMAIFMIVFGAVLYFLLGASLSTEASIAAPWSNAFLSVASFFIGGLTSVASGYLGMSIATFTNTRTAVKAAEGIAANDEAAAFSLAFQTAFRGGLTMGFGLTACGVFALFLTVKFVAAWMGAGHPQEEIYECVAAFGLGGSAIACFGRVGGGIYTKAADVGSDLVGKLESNLPEDDARNPGVIADCIGDNVGDIAGMGSDLFGSFGEASCAALVVAATSPELNQYFTAMMYPLLITSSGMLVCMGTAMLAAKSSGVTKAADIEPTLKKQLVVSTVAATAILLFITELALPDEFTIAKQHCTKWRALCCVLAGLWSGLFIGYTTEYYTSNTYQPVRDVVDACETGAATNIIYGLALGYLSVLPPTIAMAISCYLSYRMANLYGYALAALGILSTMCIALTIDAYGPISDNAGGIAEMAHMGDEIRRVTDALDAAGNTTAAIGKGFAISSAAFVGLALYGAYVTRVKLPTGVDILDARVMPGLMLGAMLPFWFSAMTMKSVGIAAMGMVKEIRRQFQDPAVADGTKEPDYNACVSIATQAALSEMIPPGALVILSPILVGILFGKHALAGLLPGALVSGVQMAISSSNTGGAWDNCKKYIEGGNLGPDRAKGSEIHKAAVVGDTVGDPLKDTSGPSLNILIKLMAIISVVLAPVVQSKFGGLIVVMLEGPTGNQ